MLCSRVWSRFRRPAAFVSLSLAHIRRRATREERRRRRIFCRFGAHRTRGKKTDDFGREAKMSFLCVNVPIQTNNKKLTLIFRRFSNYSRAEKTNRDGLNRAQPDVARPGVQGENDGAEEILRETEHGRRPGGRDDGGHGDHAGATRSAGGFGKLPR